MKFNVSRIFSKKQCNNKLAFLYIENKLKYKWFGVV